MRKTAFVSMLSFVFLALSSICTWLLSSFSPPTPWIPLGIGFVILIISGAICLKFDLYTVTPYIVFVLNLFALSLCMKAWYDFRGCQVSLRNMLLVSLIVNAVLWIYYLLLFVPFFRKHFKSFTGLYILSVLIVLVFVLIPIQIPMISTVAFYLITEIGFLFALCIRNIRFKELFESAAVSTFSILIVAIMIALLMLEADDFGTELVGGAVSGYRNKDKKEKKNARKRLRP